MIPDVVQKCIDWNAARYDQVYNYELAVKLLLEEMEELAEAPSVVEMLDAIGDITFVTIGVMWKLGITAEEIKSLFYDKHLTTIGSHEAYNYSMYIVNTFTADTVRCTKIEEMHPGLMLACMATFLVALNALRGLGMQHSFYDIVDAICESNNTKEIKGKTDASIKANVIKGPKYISPTERLKQIEFLYNVREGNA